VTEIDLRHSLIPDELIDEMIKQLPEHGGRGAPEDANIPKYDYVHFMDRFLGPQGNGHVSSNGNGHAR
jgi:hypothetical protein